MAEHHIAAAHADGRDSAARNGLPERKPYVYRGGEREPLAVTAARERHRALDAEIKQPQIALEARLDEAARKARERDG
jgi:hypothetical protein